MRILTIANIVPRKRIDLCALACQELVTRHDVLGIKWTVIGRGSKEAEVKAMAPISMEFIPVVDSLKEYYKRTDVFVLPSCDEGFGMVYIEAIMCGCPVVCRKNDGGQEIINYTGGGVAVEIPEFNELAIRNIVSGIDRILANRSQYANERTRNLAVEMVNPEKIKKQWADLLSQLLH